MTRHFTFTWLLSYLISFCFIIIIIIIIFCLKNLTTIYCLIIIIFCLHLVFCSSSCVSLRGFNFLLIESCQSVSTDSQSSPLMFVPFIQPASVPLWNVFDNFAFGAFLFRYFCSPICQKNPMCPPFYLSPRYKQYFVQIIRRGAKKKVSLVLSSEYERQKERAWARTSRHWGGNRNKKVAIDNFCVWIYKKNIVHCVARCTDRWSAGGDNNKKKTSLICIFCITFIANNINTTVPHNQVVHFDCILMIPSMLHI